MKVGRGKKNLGLVFWS